MSQDKCTANQGQGESKGPIFSYKSENDYVTRQSRRAWMLLWCYIAGLVTTAVLYLAFHLVLLEPENALKWYAIDVDSGMSERALDWVLFSLAGTLIYLMVEVGHHYQAIGDSARERSDPDVYPVSFLEKTPWNIVTLAKGPIIAVVILLFFNAADLKLTGANNQDPAFAFDFSELDHRVTLLLAFALGFYSRVARNVLDQIVKALFGRAWAEAHEDFGIEPSEAEVVLGETTVFKTKPATEVIWAASLGTIDAKTGRYDAPKEYTHCGATAVITAVSTGTPAMARSASVKLVPFKISGPDRVQIDQEYSYSVSKPPEAGEVEWSLSPDPAGGKIDKKGKYTAPKAPPSGNTVTVKANIKGKPGCYSSLEVMVTE